MAQVTVCNMQRIKMSCKLQQRMGATFRQTVHMILLCVCTNAAQVVQQFGLVLASDNQSKWTTTFKKYNIMVLRFQYLQRPPVMRYQWINNDIAFGQRILTKATSVHSYSSQPIRNQMSWVQSESAPVRQTTKLGSAFKVNIADR